MKQNSTQLSFIKYLYHETSVAETRSLRNELAGDVVLQRDFNELREAYKQLPKVKFNASKKSLRNILNYSKHTALEKQC